MEFAEVSKEHASPIYMDHDQKIKEIPASSKQPLPWFRLLATVLSVIAAVFGGYQILEWTLLKGADGRLLNTFHIIRGVASSIVVAIVVAWMILKSTPLLAEKSTPEDWAGSLVSSEEENIGDYIKWFIRMRWVAIFVAVILVFVTVKVTSLLPEEVWWPLILCIAGLVTLNILSIALFNHPKRGDHLIVLQVYGDLFLLTLLLHFSGGIENPLSLLPLVHVILSGIFLNRKQCYLVAVFASALFMFLAWGEWGDWINHYTLRIFPHGEGEPIHAAHQTLYVVSRTGLQLVLLLLSAYFVTALAEQSQNHKRRSKAMAERALAERQLVERALETTGAALRVVDTNFQPLWINNRWKEWFEDCRNQGEEADKVCCAEKQTSLDGLARISEIVVSENDGDQRIFNVTTAPLLNAEGKIREIVDLAQEITEQKRIQAQMIRTSKMAAIGELASNVAHEVNNPIAIISAKSRLLLSDYQDQISEKCRQELLKIITLSDRVAQIAQGLLFYARPSAGARTLMDVNVPIRRSLSMIEQRAKKQNVVIDDSLIDPGSCIRANSNEMEQVFLNLFLNALDAMPNEGCLTIRSRLATDKSKVEISVQDTGPGISEKIHDRVFEPFFTTKEEGRGAGLGLSICLGLIRSHDGEIEVQNGMGACFTVKLPVYQAPKEEVHYGQVSYSGG